MQIGEGIALVTMNLEEACDHTPDKTNWKCVLEGKTDGHLVPNINRDRGIAKPTWPLNGDSSIKSVSSDPAVWPSQAHHLIPWKQLKKHGAAHYLDSSKNKIWADNNYSVNHGNNGLFMPYSSDLTEWNTVSDKQKLSEELMDKVGTQLHQSRHSHTKYDGAEQGYKDRVKTYLKTISDNGLKHTDFCDSCKNKKNGNKFPPRENIVRAVDRVSMNLEKDIEDMDIFVSRRAAMWAKKRAQGVE